MRENIINSAQEIFELGKEYDRQTIEDLFLTVDVQIGNVTAYTYNRWNKGMQEICELFEHQGRSSYKYLGPKEVSKYTGPVFHYPQGLNRIHKIGNWNNGEFTFLNTVINSFQDWKNSNDLGLISVDLNSTVFFDSIDGKIKQVKFLTDDIEKAGKSNGQYMYLLAESNLGKIIIDKSLGDHFIFGNTEYKIVKII